MMGDEDLNIVSQKVKVIYAEKGKVLFRESESTHGFFYVLKEGSILLTRKEESVDTAIDICDVGEIFGLRPLLAKDNYLMTAWAEEETILYAVSIEHFRPFLNAYPNMAVYLTEVFASKTKTPYLIKSAGVIYDNIGTEYTKYTDIDGIKAIKVIKKVIQCSPEISIKEASTIMQKRNIASVVITKDKLPVGIITDKDLRNKVATGQHSIDEKVKNIMITPVHTFKDNLSITQVQFEMINKGIGKLVFTEDGTPQTKVSGIITEHDLIVTKATSASGLLKAIKRASKTRELSNLRLKVTRLLEDYISQDLPMNLIGKIINGLNEAIIQRLIEMKLRKMDTPPPVKFAWLSIGSQGREEQFLVTDQDNALVFENVPEEEYQRVQQYFLTFSAKVNKGLAKVGYEYCPANMMARNPQWCISLNEWKRNFYNWTHQSGNKQVMYCSIFFDYSFTYGSKELVSQLSESIITSTQENDMFFAFLSKSALENPPPLGFLKQFIIEQNGAHKDAFDLKLRAMMPITDLGRVLVLKHGIKGINNTAERFLKLAEIEPQNKDLFLSCSYASKALLKFRTKQGIMNKDSGRYIKLNLLSKEERLKLKRCFKVIAQVQEVVKIRFKTNMIL
ncbi:CBS domain-containing protein [Elysia marginata]|uniref:CBS domain-containing protein n=1 Tax=Elysia marginata TaxID=1093978 RepID=A0AAV4FVF5_9GAST|nr:CBS domain-containing protein [Elysia marginata]